MSNHLDDERAFKALDMFSNGASIREVCAAVKIARETAHRIQKAYKACEMENDGWVRVNTGRRKDGTMSFYITREMRPNWE